MSSFALSFLLMWLYKERLKSPLLYKMGLFIRIIYVLAAGKSGLVLRKLFGDNPDIKKTEETVRSGQMEGVVWGACKIN